MTKAITCMKTYLLNQKWHFSSPEPKDTHGPVSVRLRRRPYVVVVHNAQRSSPLKQLGQSKPNFMWSLLGYVERKFIGGIWVT